MACEVYDLTVESAKKHTLVIDPVHFFTTTTTTTFVFQALIGGKIFFSQQIFWIFGAPASEIHTIN